MSIIKQLNHLYYTEETWTTNKISNEEITKYHQRLYDSGNIIVYRELGVILGYVEVWRINFEQFGRLVCHVPFSAYLENVKDGNIAYVANTWIDKNFRRSYVTKYLKDEFFKQNQHCDFFVGEALRKKHKPIKVFKNLNQIQRSLTMGSTKISTTEYTTPEPTPEGAELNALQLEQYKQTVGPQTELQLQGMDLLSQIFGGAENLPGLFGDISKGISPEAIGTQAATLAKQYGAGFQNLGISDSGVAFQQTAQGIANELLFPTEQWNIGSQQNLLNLAMGGQAQVQQPIMAGVNQLGQSLTALNTSQTLGAQYNPFSGVNLGFLGQWGGANYGGGCWVAAEIFGGWNEPKTTMARYFINELAPKWFKKLYLKYGEGVAKFIHNKPVFRFMLRPLFEYFALKGDSHRKQMPTVRLLLS